MIRVYCDSIVVCWFTPWTSGYKALRGIGKLKERDGGGGGEEGDRGGGVSCDRVPEDGMRSDGETSDRNEEDPISAQVSPRHQHTQVSLELSISADVTLEGAGQHFFVTLVC